MASPMPMQQPSGNWAGHAHPQHGVPPAPTREELGSDRRLMGLKVSYTFDREAQVNFLARHPQPLHVNTITLSETKTIGYTDLSLCAQAIANCSPELVGQQNDYTVYAYDYSEDDTPLVGQGLLSWILQADPSEPKMVFGRLTKNVLAMLPGGSGLKDMLEVKFKLLPTNRVLRHEPRPDFARHDSHMSFDHQTTQARPQDGVMTPTGSQEWNSFLQSNPQLGQATELGRVASPAYSNHRADFPNPSLQRHDSFSYQQQQQSTDPSAYNPLSFTHQPPEEQSFDGPNRVAPTLVDPQGDSASNPPSRPASRASTTTTTTKRKRSKVPTGRPRGRPKKKPANIDTLGSQGPGSTSGYEEGTDAEEGPAKKKRATTTAATKNINAPFGGGGGPESLRVAASTAGSIRTLRPPGAAGEATQGSHLQDVPRAPTPVPAAGPRRGQGSKAAGASSLRRQSTLSQAAIAAEQNPSYQESALAMSPPSQDGRSPGDSEAASPVYSDSPGQIGSSPPVPRVTPYIRSSPPASSPTLPPMPKPQPDSGFMSGDIDDLFDESIKPFKLEPPSQPEPRPKPKATSRPKIPGTLVHELRKTQPASSDVEMVLYDESQKPYPNNYQHPFSGPPTSAPNSRPPAPPSTLKRARSDSHAIMAPPPLQTDLKDPSPQPEEPAVAVEEDMATNMSAAPAHETPKQSVEDHHMVGSQSSSDSRRTFEAQESAEGRQSMESQGPSDSQERSESQQTRIEESTPGQNELFERLTTAAREISESQGSLPPASTALDLFARPPPPNPRQHSRSASATSQQQLPPIPASDPIGTLALPSVADSSFSEAPGPKSPRSNKNYVKKTVIRLRLEEAIAAGQMPSYCTNCGAIETPTWRKIWTQEHEGVPEFHEFSEKPGKVTAVIVLDRDDDGKPTKYQLIKKGLAQTEDKDEWSMSLLCNPCGIWLTKWKNHRPSEKWDRSTDKPRTRRRGRGGRSTKRSKTGVEATSEAAFETDPAGPEGMDVSTEDLLSKALSMGLVDDTNSREASLALEQALRDDSQPPSREHRSRPGSTHSRGSGTAKSPIPLDADAEEGVMGATRRLLFPSPRKDGLLKVLSEVAVNVVQVETDGSGSKDAENRGLGLLDGVDHMVIPDDELEALFRSPMARPSTPPPKDSNANSGPFKTPTRPTPSHRPVTRSISKSIKSGRSRPSPAQALAMLQATPTRTPRSVARILGGESPSLRRSPRFTAQDESASALFETPMTRSISQMLSDYGVDDDGLGLGNIAGLPDLDGHDDVPFDFGSLLGSDGAATSSPSRTKRGAGFDYVGTANMWAEWGTETPAESQE